jgi:hypothetical protein
MTDLKFNLEGVHPFIGMPAHRELSPFTNASLIETATALRARGIVFDQRIVFGGSVVTAARTSVANQFLETKADRLFWIDSDIVWTADDFLTILALSTELECVGATYPSKEMPPKFMLNVLDTSADMETNDHGCFEMKGFGLGFTCVQRKVIEQLAAKAPKLVFPGNPNPVPHMFREDSDNGAFRGEDMAFFADVRALGYKVNLFPHINLGHVGPHVFRANLMASLKEIDNASRNESAALGSIREQQEASGPAAEGSPDCSGSACRDDVGREGSRQGSDRTEAGLLPRRPEPSEERPHGRAGEGAARRPDMAAAG